MVSIVVEEWVDKRRVNTRRRGRDGRKEKKGGIQEK